MTFAQEAKSFAMTRSRFIVLFGATATSAVALDQTTEELAEDAEICAIASALIQSYISGDFKAVARAMHPAALKLIYDRVSTGYRQGIDRVSTGYRQGSSSWRRGLAREVFSK